jgi:hypothetical protein
MQAGTAFRNFFFFRKIALRSNRRHDCSVEGEFRLYEKNKFWNSPEGE